ncbi:hypothetical protein [Gemmatimonas sp.]|uniref:hypothetical protein n=1 Tax=Gemmatimonas sp. TaxID=1962908 RepID=UPI003566D08D
MEGLLERFVRLCEDTDGQLIARYAQRFGVLEICSAHGLPSSHLPQRYSPWATEASFCLPGRSSTGTRREPLEAWRSYSKMAQAILNIAARLHQSQKGAVPAREVDRRRRNQREGVPPEMWKPLTGLAPSLIPSVLENQREDPLIFELADGSTRPHTVKPAEAERIKLEVSDRNLSEQRRLLAFVVEQWLTIGDVRLRYVWEDRPHFDMAGGTLFGALGIQVALAVARSEGLAICSECGLVYVPKRRSRGDGPTRCPEKACRIDAAKRDSARKRRAAERAKNATKSEREST